MVSVGAGGSGCYLAISILKNTCNHVPPQPLRIMPVMRDGSSGDQPLCIPAEWEQPVSTISHLPVGSVMQSELAPDPYIALGTYRDADGVEFGGISGLSPRPAFFLKPPKSPFNPTFTHGTMENQRMCSTLVILTSCFSHLAPGLTSQQLLEQLT